MKRSLSRFVFVCVLVLLPVVAFAQQTQPQVIQIQVDPNLAKLATGILSAQAARADSPPVPSVLAMRIVHADAPDWITENDLGLPLDANFQKLVGPDGATLFPEAGAPTQHTLNARDSESGFVETSSELAANASYWRISGNVGTATSNRYGYYRAVEKSVEYDLQEQTRMRPPPAQAVYFPTRIVKGHSYTAVISGDKTAFHAGVKARLFTLGGGVEVRNQYSHLTESVFMRGFTPRDGQSIYATGGDVATKYVAAPSAAVPIIVEYRRLPNRQVGANDTIEWEQAKRLEVRFGHLNVGGAGSIINTWSNWRMTAICTVAEATGRSTRYPKLLLDQRIADRASTDLSVSLTIPEIYSGDAIECLVGGTYTRGSDTTFLNLGTGTTGRITMDSLVTSGAFGTRGGAINPTAEPNTDWNLSWTMSRY